MRRGLVIAALLAVGCSSGGDGDVATPSPAGSPTTTSTPSPTPAPTPDVAAAVRVFVTDFMDARMARDAERARGFLGPAAAQAYDDNEGGLTLVGTSNPHFDSWTFVSIQQADANSYEVQVEVTEATTGSSETSTFEEVLFVGPGTDVDGGSRPYVVRGAQRV